MYLPSAAAFWDVDVPMCPDGAHRAYSAAFWASALLTVSGVVLALRTAMRYNHVRMLNQKISLPTVSNGLWLWLFASYAVRGACELLFVLAGDEQWRLRAALVIVDVALFGAGATLLVCALNHQLRFRSRVLLPDEVRPIIERLDHPLRRASPWHAMGRLDVAVGLMFVCFAAALVAEAAHRSQHGENVTFALCVALTALVLRLPAVPLLCRIMQCEGVCAGGDLKTSQNATRAAKAALAVGVTLNVLGDLPFAVWAEIGTTDGAAACDVAGVLSLVDGAMLLVVLALIAYFVFLRSEFRRYRSQILWIAIQSSAERSSPYNSGAAY